MFTLVTQLTKSVVKKLAHYGLVYIFGTNTSCPSKAMQSGILSIIHTINKPKRRPYSVFGK